MAHIACRRCRSEASLFVKYAREENWRKRKWWYHYASIKTCEDRIATLMKAARNTIKYCNAAR